MKCLRGLLIVTPLTPTPVVTGYIAQTTSQYQGWKKQGFVVRGEKKDDSLGNSDQSRSRLNWMPRQKRGY